MPPARVFLFAKVEPPCLHRPDAGVTRCAEGGRPVYRGQVLARRRDRRTGRVVVPEQPCVWQPAAAA